MFSKPIDALYGILGIQLWGIARDGFEYSGHIRVYPFGNNDSLLHFETTDLDWPYLRPWWEQIHAGLPQSKLFRKAEPAQAKRDKDAPKIGAPRLAELDDAQATVKKNKLREYLRLILRPRDPQKKDVAAGQVGLARTTLDRYRRTWPEIETEVMQELGAHKVRKV